MDLEIFAVRVVAIALMGIAGLIAHEGCHYIVGWFSGGTPYVDAWWHGLPTRIAFESPERMTDFQVRLMGGLVCLFPVSLLLCFFMITPRQFEIVAPIFAFFMGGSGISDTDIMATTKPEVWKRFAKGEPIYVDDF